MGNNLSKHHSRIIAVFEGQQPDRIPICQQAFASSTASEILGRQVWTGGTELMYAEARAWIKGESAHDEFVDRLLEDTVALHRFFDFDILFLPWRMCERPSKQIDEYSFLYGDYDSDNWAIYKLDPISRTYGLSQSSGRSNTVELVKNDIEEMIKSPPESSGDIDPLLLEAVKRYGEEFVVSGFGGMAIPLEPAWLELTILEPKIVSDYMDVLLEQTKEQIKKQNDFGIKLINGGGDFAFNSGPVYSPQVFKTIMLPKWIELFKCCREQQIQYIFRSDGNLWPVANDLFLTARPEAYFEVDYDAGMHFEQLREAFPELVLIGNVSCDALLNASPSEIESLTKKCIEAAFPRVIISTSNAILHGTPAANVFSLYETAKHFLPQPESNKGNTIYLV